LTQKRPLEKEVYDEVAKKPILTRRRPPEKNKPLN